MRWLCETNWFLHMRSVIYCCCSVAIALCLFAGCCSTGDTPRREDIDLSTPQATVLNLYRAFNDEDAQLLESVLDMDDESNRMALEAFKQQVSSEISYESTDIEIDIVENDGQMARVRTRFYQRILIGERVVAEGKTGNELSLVCKAGRWYLIGLGQWPLPGWVKEFP